MTMLKTRRAAAALLGAGLLVGVGAATSGAGAAPAKNDQTISVSTHAPSAATYSTAFTVHGSASSGLEVSYSASGSCSNVGDRFTMTSGSGTCVVKYDQVGDATYNPTTRQLGNGIVAVKLDANSQMQIVDWFAPPNANWMRARDLDVNVSPMAFDYRGKKFLVGTSKECRMWLLDRDALGGEDHRTSVYTTPLLCNDDQAFDGRGVWGSMAAWQDARGAQWVLVPFWGPVSRDFKAPIENGRPKGGGVGAYKVEQVAGKWRLNPAWLSDDMDLAEEVMVANGVVFAYGGGEDASQTVPDTAWNETGGGRNGGGLDSSATRRIPGSRHATLYALDAQTGKTLWSSGTQISSWNHFSGLTVANGRAYIATFDGMLYCFGVARPATAGR